MAIIRGKDEPSFPQQARTTIINLTSLLGGFLAILATLIPKPLLNTKPFGREWRGAGG